MKASLLPIYLKVLRDRLNVNSKQDILIIRHLYLSFKTGPYKGLTPDKEDFLFLVRNDVCMSVLSPFFISKLLELVFRKTEHLETGAFGKVYLDNLFS